MNQVGVLGCGLMGRGIAQVSALAGHATVVREVADEFNEKGKAGIEKSLAKFVEKEKLSAEDRHAALGRLSFTTDLVALGDCDIIIEAVTEDLDLKNKLWKELDGLCPDHTIFASNTSSLTIAAMAAATSRPDRFVGLHFFNPVPLMKLVESGFIVNLLLVPYLIDAIRALEGGVGTIGDIDKGMVLGTWALSRSWTSWASTRRTRSRRSCSASIEKRDTPHRRC
jgi:3-hydroxybutyryl-CoA dehydrogenase